MKNPPELKLRERLMLHRKRTRVTQTELGVQLGVSREIISRIERGLRPSGALTSSIENFLKTHEKDE